MVFQRSSMQSIESIDFHLWVDSLIDKQRYSLVIAKSRGGEESQLIFRVRRLTVIEEEHELQYIRPMVSDDYVMYLLLDAVELSKLT